MPTAQKVSWAKLKVGLLAIGAMVILGVLIFYLTGTTKLFSKEVDVYTYMDDAAAIAKGSPVRLNGILIGKIDDVQLSGEKNPRRIVKIAMRLEADKLALIPVDSVAAISAENLLGSKFINIKKGQSSTTIQPGAEVPSLDTREFDELVQQGYQVLSSLQVIVKRIDAIVSLVEVGKGSIGKLLVDEELYNKVLAIVNEGQKITAALNTNKGTIGRLLNDDAMYNDVRTSLARVDSLLQDLQQGKGTAGKLLRDEALYEDTRKSMAEVRKTLEDLNAGKGTAGRLLKSDELANELKTTLDKVDLTIDKVNSGQGTIGQLLVNQQLYDNLNGATRELHELFKDFRSNPKKFLHVKLSLF